MKRPDPLPNPKDLKASLSDSLNDCLATANMVAAIYKELYSMLGNPSGGSMGQVRSGGGVSDPTRDQAVSRDVLRSAARRMAGKVRYAAKVLGEAHTVGDDAMNKNKTGKPDKSGWKVHTWTTLPCRCKQDDQGWWIVSRRCPLPEHLNLIPEKDRAPFLATDLRSEYGAFKPVAEGPAS